MEHLNRLSSYFVEKERKRLDGMIRESRSGLPEMTPDEIKLSCVENNGYETPELNEKLYLHFRGFKKIENLEAYTACKALWLDSNGFETIENLEALQELRCLYMSKNLFTRIDGLANLQHLTVLDLSNNRLSVIENLACCPSLQTVNVSRNSLVTVDSIAHFQLCLALTNIDVTFNKLETDEKIMEVFQSIPALVALSVNGNEFTKLPYYRKRMIASIPKLGYLDRPVDEMERYIATAFAESGADGETAARDRWREMQREKKAEEMSTFRAWQQDQKRLRDEARAEGRLLHYIKEFTPEEMAQRAAEAERVAETEKRVLGMGVGKLAARYWKLEGNRDGTVDPLDEATNQLLREDEQQQQRVERGQEHEPEEDAELAGGDGDKDKAHAEVEVVVVAGQGPGDETEEINPSLMSALPPPPSPSALLPPNAHVDMCTSADHVPIDGLDDNFETQVADEKGDEGDDEADERLVVPPPPLSTTMTVKERRQAQAEQREREQRVADSLRIYKQQLEAERAAKAQKDAVPIGRNILSHEASSSSADVATAAGQSAWAHGGSTPTSTWNLHGTSTSNPLGGASARSALYWSETMDLRLAQEVQACMFDFEAVSGLMAAAAQSGAFHSPHRRSHFMEGSDPRVVHVDTITSALTAEACRVRWSQLDAEQWAELAPDTSAVDTVYKIYVQPDTVSAGHGGQPTFQALARMAAGSMPAYLSPPRSFPSVQDVGDDDDDDDLRGDNEEGEAPVAILSTRRQPVPAAGGGGSAGGGFRQSASVQGSEDANKEAPPLPSQRSTSLLGGESEAKASTPADGTSDEAVEVRTSEELNLDSLD